MVWKCLKGLKIQNKASKYNSICAHSISSPQGQGNIIMKFYNVMWRCVASWLVCLTPDWAVQISALVGNIVLRTTTIVQGVWMYELGELMSVSLISFVSILVPYLHQSLYMYLAQNHTFQILLFTNLKKFIFLMKLQVNGKTD